MLHTGTNAVLRIHENFHHDGDYFLCQSRIAVVHSSLPPANSNRSQQFNLIKLSALNGLEEGTTVNFDVLRETGESVVYGCVVAIGRICALLGRLKFVESACGEYKQIGLSCVVAWRVLYDPVVKMTARVVRLFST